MRLIHILESSMHRWNMSVSVNECKHSFIKSFTLYIYMIIFRCGTQQYWNGSACGELINQKMNQI